MKLASAVSRVVLLLVALIGGCSSSVHAETSREGCPESYPHVHCAQPCPLECANEGRCFESKRGTTVTEEFQDGPPFMGNQDAPYLTNPFLSDYACHCYGQFTGYLCDIPYTNCGDGTRCFYGGECQPENQREPCKCAAGYLGRFCEVDTAERKAGIAGIAGVPTNSTNATNNGLLDSAGASGKKKPLGPIMISLAVGLVVGFLSVLYYEKRRRFRATWLVTSHSGSSSFDNNSKTFINVV